MRSLQLTHRQRCTDMLCESWKAAVLLTALKFNRTQWLTCRSVRPHCLDAAIVATVGRPPSTQRSSGRWNKGLTGMI